MGPHGVSVRLNDPHQVAVDPPERWPDRDFWKKRLWSLGTLNVEICFRIWCVAYKFVLVG